MKKKTIFFDIDGTLLDHDKKIPKSTKKAVKELKEKGHNVAIATGRAPFMFDWIRDELKIDTYVCYNGQYVVFQNELIYENPIQSSILDQVLEESKKLGHPIAFMGQESVVVNTRNHPYMTEGFASLKMEVPRYEPEFYKNNKVYQSLLFCKSHEITHYEPYLNDVDLVRWHTIASDILPKGGSKAKGIEMLLDYLNVDLRNTVAFGDALNDREMLTLVECGVAMGNALPEVKSLADFVTRDVNEDGIYFGVKELGLI